MNREIKFRAKCKHDGRWLYGYYHANLDLSIHWIICIDTGIEYQVEPKTIGQYTGLSDKNGKEIYEDHVVKHDDGKLGKIEYDQGRYIIEFSDGIIEDIFYHHKDAYNTLTIIGN